MNVTLVKYPIVFCLYLLISNNGFAQKTGYQKDSLQIKVYSEIIYENNKVESLKVKKIFCDYCSENQLKVIKQEAWHRAYEDRYSKKNRLKDGKRRLALYIRIAKKDFLNFKEANKIDNKK